ncbi:glycine--tRNA ligase subunit beta [Granulicella tundricola]|uniref:Glycine--tRNA ligase beta subunit n=1 Tax=Granulicella tundricola (strain ATCC BAA-1859 / DSM 23138 / MP5ACTX9) TaxID=1198114 RepID=E8WWI1_GRATM|nr:glycine--tRNA ligase subunit beta [Granulicella tundricola]ADW69645.1 glycyl-tRNA synthetase, beta subunit [Granulicella tundricola MP5ACTX9]
MADFLFEIGLEEVPARMIAQAEAELLKRTVGLLERERLVAGAVEAKSYSTPRRLAVVVKGVLARQEDVSEEVLGPATKIAFKDGQPGPAAVAFAKKNGVEVSALRVVTNAKGEYVAATSVKAGRSAAAVLAEELPKEIAGIYWAKNMYWRAGRPERFVRPVRWLVALLGDEIVPVSFGGYEAGRVTYGHRVLFGDAAIAVTPASYVEELAKASVMVDVEGRRHVIRKALDKVCRTAEGTRWREDHGLVDKMTHMTEWPSVILGGFEKEYLALPEEVLVTVMRDHQNYFAVESADGKLAPHFLAVLNTVADETGQAVIRHGNERVLRARFNDARFFWEFDQRVPLEERVALLENVTFQKDLGSYAAKSVRVGALALSLAATVPGVDLEALKAAARLAKTDLTTELVKEFTELQGEVGGLYAEAQGVAQAACNAIYDQYRPVSTEDRIPRTVEGQLLAMADKADTIAGMFGLGLEPTGSKDPFALRRAANGIVKILGEGATGLGIGQVVRAAVGDNLVLVRKLEVFFAERLEFYLREAKGQAYDVVAAVLGAGADDVRDAVARAEAVTAVRGSEDFAAVSAAFKRMKNILAQAAEKGIAPGTAVDISLLKDGAELALAEKAAEVKPEVAALRGAHEYRGALELIATLRPQVNAFFEAVMVMDPDEAVRANRLALLGKVLGDFGGIAEFSEIVVAG